MNIMKNHNSIEKMMIKIIMITTVHDLTLIVINCLYTTRMELIGAIITKVDFTMKDS